MNPLAEAEERLQAALARARETATVALATYAREQAHAVALLLRLAGNVGWPVGTRRTPAGDLVARLETPRGALEWDVAPAHAALFAPLPALAPGDRSPALPQGEAPPPELVDAASGAPDPAARDARLAEVVAEIDRITAQLFQRAPEG